jgi:hypothetical protein
VENVEKDRCVGFIFGNHFHFLLMCDHWTSPNHHAFFCVVGHAISATGDLVTAQLRMEHFREPHTDANQAKIIWKLLEQYGLRHKVGYFTTDKATINDTAVYELAKLFSNVNVAFYPVSACMWCFARIFTHMVQVFLSGQNADAVVQQLGDLDDDVGTMQKLQLWQK